MADYTLYYWPVPFRGQFIRAILAMAGKSWDEADDVAQLTKAAPEKQPVPFMGPPMLIEKATGFHLAEMPAIALYLGETLGLLPGHAAGRALSIKMVNDANDVIDELTLDGGREMWTMQGWRDFAPRLRRWMAIFEVTGQRNGLTPQGGYLFDRGEAGIADIVTATLWGTMSEKFPPIGAMLKEEAPLMAGLTERLMAAAPLRALIAWSQQRFGDAYCGGQIEKSLRQVMQSDAAT